MELLGEMTYHAVVTSRIGISRRGAEGMKVGIIGAGQISRVHGSVIVGQPNTTLVGIADRDLQRAKSLASDLGIHQVYSDARAMIEEQKPDVVHVLVPPQHHASVSMMALDLGCHVLVEKPMALTLEDAKFMAEASSRNNVKLCVNHNMIYEGVVQKAVRLIRQGDIGELVSIEANHVYNARRDLALLEDGAEHFYWSYRLNGGPLQDLMPHMASILFEFMPEIQEVQSVGLNRGILPKGWQDEIRVLIRSERMTGYISLSLSQRPDTIIVTFKGTRGVIQANLYNNILTIQKRSILPRAVVRGLSGFHAAFQDLKGASQNLLKFAFGKVDKTSGIGHVVPLFYQAIQGKGEVPTSLDKSLRVVDMIARVWPEPRVDSKTLGVANPRVGATTSPTVLVTGASGFIGVHIIQKLLSENLRVRALVRSTSVHRGRLMKYDVDVVEGDLADPVTVAKALEGIRTVVHAGSAMNNRWHDHMQSTVKGTENMIQACHDHQVDRLVFLSSPIVYEVNSLKKRSVIKEDSLFQKNPRAMGPYVYAKIEAEKMLMEAYRKQGLKISILRPGLVIGPTGRIFFPHMGFKLQDALFVVLRNGKNKLPITYVENLVDAIYLAMVKDEAIGQIYNVVDDEMSVMEYLRFFKQVTGIDSRVIRMPYFMFYTLFGALELASRMGVLKKGASSRAQFKWKHKPVTFDSSKIRGELGWEPHVPLREGLAKTFQWYAENHAS